MRLYLNTSVLGALFDSEEPQRVAASERLLHSVAGGVHLAHISPLTLEEITRAPEPIARQLRERLALLGPSLLPETAEAAGLAAAYDAAGILPPAARDDLRHVAIAVVHRMDALISWNYRHLVNIDKRRQFCAVNLRLGYPLMEIVSPLEVPTNG